VVIEMLSWTVRYPPMSKKRVLVVDDDEEVISLITTIAELEGYEVKAARNGAEGLAMLREGRFHPDLILLDLMMPVMDGWTFSREVRRTAAARETPIVVLSGVHDLPRKVEGLPVNGFVAKPFEYDELVSWLDRAAAN